MRLRYPVLAAALAAAAIAAMAHEGARAAPRVSVETVYYEVRGSSPQTLLAYMLRHGPGGASGRALGTTSAVLRQDADFSGDARCRLQNYYVALDLEIRVPKLAGGQRLSSAVRQQWDQLATHVRRHENTHRTIYERCARRIERRVRAIDGTMACQALRAQMRRIFNEENNRCDAEHRSFDARESVAIRALPLISRASARAPAQQAESRQSATVRPASSAPQKSRFELR